MFVYVCNFLFYKFYSVLMSVQRGGDGASKKRRKYEERQQAAIRRYSVLAAPNETDTIVTDGCGKWSLLDL